MALARRTQVGIPDAGSLRAMQALAIAYPDRATHITDLPYRLAWLGHDEPGHAGHVEIVHWYTGAELVAWAVWVPGWWEVDVATHPAHATALWPEILMWGADRCRSLAATRNRTNGASWWVSAWGDDPERIAMLEASGFRLSEWFTLRFAACAC